jgi:secreted trypsin-like serine protease
MVVRQQSNTYIQLGVASFYSSKGCSAGNPSGFTRLRNYVDWINSTSGATSVIAQFMFTILTGVTIIFARSG